LPERAQGLVSDIESRSESEIELVHNPGLPDFALCEIVPRSGPPPAGRIYYRSAQEPQFIAHEILHLHRYLVDGIPQVRYDATLDESLASGTAPVQAKGAHQMDLHLEHAVIYGREAYWGHFPELRFERDCVTALAETWTGMAQRVVGIMCGVLILMHARRHRAEAMVALRKVGLASEVIELKNSLAPVVETDKVQAARLAAAVCGIPITSVRLDYVWPRRTEPLE
jgi:hypothetical protein